MLMIGFPKRFLAILFAAFLLAQAPMSLATESFDSAPFAIAPGREVRFDVSATWQGQALVPDEAMNTVIDAMLNALTFTGAAGTTEEGVEYGQFALMLQDQPAMSVDAIVAEEGPYIVSSLYPQPIAISGMEESLQVLSNFAALLEDAAEMPRGTIMGSLEDAVGQAMSQMQASQTMTATLNEEDFAELIAACTAWGETALAGESYEGAMQSVYGLDVKTAQVYDITMEELISLLDEILPLMAENDALLALITESVMSNYDMMYEEMPSQEEMLATLKEGLAEAHAALADAPLDFPMDLYYAQCFDEDGNPITNTAQLYVDEQIDIYLEWLEGFGGVYAHVIADGNGFAVEYGRSFGQEADLNGKPATMNAASVTFTLVDGGEVDSQFAAEFANYQTEDKTVTGSLALYGGAANDAPSGLVVSWDAATEYGTGDDQTTTGNTAFSLFMGDASIPLFTVSFTVENCAASALPFDPAELEFLHLGTMDEDTFVTWFQEDMMTHAMGQAFTIMGMLPPEVLALFME